MELWDAYDSNFNIIEGVTLVRGEPIPEGMFHLSCSVLVRHTDGTYLIIKRKQGKAFGGMWEATCGGSAMKDETPGEGAARELREETGLVKGKLHEMGRLVNRKIRSLFAVYLFITDVPKDSIVSLKGETVDYRWVTGDELMAMPQSMLITPKDLLCELYPELRSAGEYRTDDDSEHRERLRKELKCVIHPVGYLETYKFVVICTYYGDKMILSKHKSRDTWETQGGHIEAGETPLEAARRELYEESGIDDAEIIPVCDYFGYDSESHSNGMVFLAKVNSLGSLPESEMEKIGIFDSMPENLTYPLVTPRLYAEVTKLL